MYLEITMISLLAPRFSCYFSPITNMCLIIKSKLFEWKPIILWVRDYHYLRALCVLLIMFYSFVAPFLKKHKVSPIHYLINPPSSPHGQGMLLPISLFLLVLTFRWKGSKATERLKLLCQNQSWEIFQMLFRMYLHNIQQLFLALHDNTD